MNLDLIIAVVFVVLFIGYTLRGYRACANAAQKRRK